MAKRRAKRSAEWAGRQARDPYVRRARATGFRSRAAFKLVQIDQKDRLVQAGDAVVDLGAAPGGWSQYVAARVGSQGIVVAVDRLEFPPITGVTRIIGDFTATDIALDVKAALGQRPANLVISDLAPNITGVSSIDQAGCALLARAAHDFALSVLTTQGTLVVKLFEGVEGQTVRQEVAHRFARCVVRKPDASRSGSREFYLVARGPRPLG
ncbi:MAG: RlmE family RNA methyltransferase [Arenicellales bacterium]|nr:RlmE family RNA methyltransferase [Arenicellales bacterium]|tara:strand:- start:5659 stop:6291 length:633 start_codon:yes stop_codon:yes gene_type:complete